MYINETAMTVCTEYCDTELGLVISAMETETGEMFCQRFSLESIFVDPVTSNVTEIIGKWFSETNTDV